MEGATGELIVESITEVSGESAKKLKRCRR